MGELTLTGALIIAVGALSGVIVFLDQRYTKLVDQTIANDRNNLMTQGRLLGVVEKALENFNTIARETQDVVNTTHSTVQVLNSLISDKLKENADLRSQIDLRLCEIEKKVGITKQ